MPEVLITLGVALTGIALDDLLGTYERSFRNRRISDRTSHGANAIYTLFYADSGFPREVILDAWREVAEILSVDAGKLRPADQLYPGLAFHPRLRGSRSDMDRLMQHVRKGLEDGNFHRVKQLRTVDDAVRCLAISRHPHYRLAEA